MVKDCQVLQRLKNHQYNADSVYSSVLNISLSVTQPGRTLIKTQANIDSGATHNFISVSLAKGRGWVLNSLQRPFQIQLANGSKVFSTHTITLQVRHSNQTWKTLFYILPQSTHEIILEMPWLRAVNPAINWNNATLTFGDTSLPETPDGRNKSYGLP